MQTIRADDKSRDLILIELSEYCLFTKIASYKVSMIRKYHNHEMQTNPRHREEKLQKI